MKKYFPNKLTINIRRLLPSGKGELKVVSQKFMCISDEHFTLKTMTKLDSIPDEKERTICRI